METNKQVKITPPDANGYNQARPKEYSQFGFLIGEWDYIGYFFNFNGSVKQEYTGFQEGEYTFDERMIVEKYYRYKPNGKVDSMGTIAHTYSIENKHWVSSSQPAYGFGLLSNSSSTWVNGEMKESGKVTVASWLPFKLSYKSRFFEISKNSYSWELHIWLLKWIKVSRINHKRRK